MTNGGKMKFGLMRCCTTPIFLRHYEWSTDAVFRRLGLELMDVKGIGCCGYPVRNSNFKAYVLATARNLALSERENLDLVTICNCCFGSMKHVDHLMKNNGPVWNSANEALKSEGLTYKGNIEARHLLDVLYRDVGPDELEKRLVRRYKNLKIAVHYGCHLLRPSGVIGFDDPNSPTKFDRLVEITGAESIAWRTKLECCGSPVWGVDDELAGDLTVKKIRDAKASGADYICVACSYCQLQFDRVQKRLQDQGKLSDPVPSILYTQLLGLCLGIDEETLGIGMNQVPLGSIEGFLS